MNATAVTCAMLVTVAATGCGNQVSAKDACPHLEQLSAQRQPYSDQTLTDIIDSTRVPFDDNQLTVDADHVHATAQALNAAVKANTTQVTSLADQLESQMFTVSQDCSRIVGGG